MQGVPVAGGHVVHGAVAGLGALGRHRQDGGHHHVDGDHVDDALGDTGELLQQAPAVGDDDGLGHPEAPDPARRRLGQGRLDDRRPHDGDGHVTLLLRHRPLGEGLGIGVGVGPAQRLGPRPTGLHQAVGHPLLAQLLGLGGQQRWPRRAQLGPRLLGEAGQQVGAAALGVGVGAGPAGGVDLGPPVQVGAERGLGERRLGRQAPAAPGHVGGRHGDDVGRGIDAGHRRQHPQRAEQVDLNGRVERRVEADPCRRVDDRRARGEQGPALLVEPEAVGGDVARHHVDAALDLGVEVGPSSWRRRRKASLPNSSRLARWAGLVRRPGRTSRTSSQSGTDRNRRSTRAVPRNPVAPVTAMRRPARASLITSLL